MDKIVVIDGETRLKNRIDGETLPVIKGGGGTRDYEKLINKPQIESVTLIGNKTFEDLGLEELSGDDLIRILQD